MNECIVRIGVVLVLLDWIVPINAGVDMVSHLAAEPCAAAAPAALPSPGPKRIWDRLHDPYRF